MQHAVQALQTQNQYVNEMAPKVHYSAVWFSQVRTEIGHNLRSGKFREIGHYADGTRYGYHRALAWAHLTMARSQVRGLNSR